MNAGTSVRLSPAESAEDEEPEAEAETRCLNKRLPFQAHRKQISVTVS